MTQFEWIVQGGDVVLSDGVKRLDIGIAGGVIAALGEQLDAGNAQIIPAAGLTVLPGAIDVHVHLNEPGLGHWEGFRTGTSALAAGGCTTCFDMPLNGRPPTVSLAALKRKQRAAESASRIDYGLWGGLMPGFLDQIEPLAEAGVIGFKAFMSSPGTTEEGDFREVDDLLLLRGMARIAPTGRLLALHAESESIVSALADEMRNEGLVDARSYAMTRPVWAERDAVRRALLAAELTGCPVHFVHISSAEAVMDIAEARRSGVDASIETCAHYLTLTVDDFVELGAIAKCAPPLRDTSNLERMWELIADGTIDLVSSDHSPCPPELKLGDNYFEIWGGISGAQSTMELMLDEGCLKRGISLVTAARVLATAPARRFGISDRKGEIRIGLDADLAIVDMNQPYTLKREHLLDRHRQSPYVGKTFGCRVLRTLVRGQTVYEAGGAGIADNQLEGILIRPTGFSEAQRIERGNAADGRG
ncbi:allantoinase [Paenibacillus curdlanolyticus YK9]|uniref:Allantoinase n=1 Tax=Paenibacillus curdlanolyticus YK9 TaxID=717606 RepID=E0IDV3_9BACL|nr:allantoinase AllB [Paenibacillus curdlanolyticus]EFM09307.1 allantoinase [Paenibacillus curdlanolyticus YK9]